MNGILQFKTAVATPPVADRRASARPEVKRIVVPFSVKAESIDEDERTFEGMASVWGLDLGDDVMHKGAFKKWLKEFKTSPDSLPLLNSHNHFDVMQAFGQMIEAKETDDGLWSKWEVINGPDGDALLERLRPSARTGKSAVSRMSIGYEPTKVDFEESDEARFGQVRNLREVRLKEVSLVLFPMAPGARIDVSTVKNFGDDLLSTTAIDDETKAALRVLNTRIGKILSRKNAPNDAPPAVADDDEGGQPKGAGATASPPVASTPPATSDEPGGEKQEPVYLYGDALRQRLLGLKLSSTINQTQKID